MIPSGLLVGAAGLPLLLSILGLAVPSLLVPMVLVDAIIVLVAALDAILARGRLVRVDRAVPKIFSIGRHNPVTLEISSLARRPLSVEINDDLFESARASELPLRVNLPARGRVTAVYRVRPSRRGAHELGAHWVRYRSPLGLFWRQLELPARDPVKVYPDVKAVRTYDMLARQNRESAVLPVRMRGGESEFERLREYQKDDEFRTIDWKATARRHKLIAREYQLEKNQNIVGLLDCGRLMTAEMGGLSHLDHALNANLMMSHVAARAGDQVGMLAFDDRVRRYVPPAGGARAAQKIIQASYDLSPALVESNYAAAFDMLSVRLRKRALVVLFTQLIDDVATKTVLGLMRGLLPRHLPLCVLFRDVEIEKLAEPPATENAPGDLDLYTESAAAEAALWRERVVRNLKASGALVLHVAPGELTPRLIDRYLEIKARRLL